MRSRLQSMYVLLASTIYDSNAPRRSGLNFIKLDGDIGCLGKRPI